MTAHHPSTAALLAPAHGTFRESGAFLIAGGVLPEMTRSERTQFEIAVTAWANGQPPAGWRWTPVSDPGVDEIATRYGVVITTEQIEEVPQDSAPARRDGAVGHGAATTYKPAVVTS